jgi:RNA polymerase sigma-70 factor (ECF subfamily)
VEDRVTAPLPSSPPTEKLDTGDLVESAFRRHYDQVYRFLRRQTGDAGRAEELTQTVFADAAAAHHKLVDRPDRPVLAWLYTVARRRAHDERLREQRRRVADGHVEGTGRSDPGLAQTLRSAIDALPEGQRQVIVLKLLRGHSFAEISDATGVSVDACKMRFSRGLATVRGELARQGIEP